MPYLNDKVGYRHQATSLEAATKISPAAHNYEAKCLAVLKANGPSTPDEVAQALDVSVLTVRPRFTALHKAGRIINTGLRRKNAGGRSTMVWRLRDQ